MSLSPRAFQVVPKGDRWLASGHQGEVIGSFTRKEQAEQAVAMRKRIYELVHGQQTPRTLSQGAEEAASAEVAKAGRPLAEQSAEAAPQSQQLLEFAAQPKPAAEQSAPALTPEDLEKALAKQKAPPGKPVSTARAARSQQPPNLAQASGEVERKRRGKRGEAKERQRRRKLADTLGQGVGASGGFVLEDPSTGLSAHELSAMLAQGLGGNPAAPAVQPAAAAPASPSAQPAARPIPQPGTRGPAASPAAPIGRRSAPPPPASPITVPAAASPQLPAAAPGARPAAPGPATLGPRDVRIPNLKNTAQAAAQAKTLPIPRTSAGPTPQQHMQIGPKGSTTPKALDKAGDSSGKLVSVSALIAALTALFTKLPEQLAKKLKGSAGQHAADGAAKSKAAGASTSTPRATLSDRARTVRQGVGAIGRLFRGGKKAAAADAGAADATAAAEGTALRAGAAGGPWGEAAAGAVVVGIELTKLAKKAVTLPHVIEQWTSGLLDSERQLRQFNASMANSYAMLERQQLILAGRQAAATAGSTRALAKSEMELREATQPQKELAANVKNAFGIAINKIGTKIAEGVNKLFFLEKINKALEDYFNEAADKRGPPAFEFLDRVAQGKWDMPKNSDPRPTP